MAGNTYAGKNLRIRVDGKTIFHATECSFTTSRNMESIASKDTNGEKVTPGNYTWGVSTNFLVANIPSGSTTQIATKQVLDIYQSGTEVQIQFTTDIEGDIIITGQSFIESINMSAPTNGVAAGDAAFKGNGDFITSGSVTEDNPTADTTPPTAPVILNYDNNIVDPFNSSLRRFTIHFTPSVETESNLIGYEIYLNGGFGGYFSFGIGGNPTFVDIINLAPATDYAVKIRAKNSYNLLSDFSNEISVSTLS